MMIDRDTEMTEIEGLAKGKEGQMTLGLVKERG